VTPLRPFTPGDGVWTEELARAGSGGVAAGIGAHPSTPRQSGSSAPRSRSRAAWCPARVRHRDDLLPDVYVPEEQLLKELNKGLSLIMANFRWERLLMALGWVGGMTSLLERAVARARLGPIGGAATRS
jgi:hypothetical protein